MMSTDIATMEATPMAISSVLMEQVLIKGDLSNLTPAQRTEYYAAVCKSLGLNPLTKPFEYLQLEGKLVLYAKRDCTDQLRQRHKIHIAIVSRERIEDCYMVLARAHDSDGRIDESLGVVSLTREDGEWKTSQQGRRYFVGNGTILPLRGEALANALMRAETKAKRRVTLSIVGLGWMDESEAESVDDRMEIRGTAPREITAGRETPTSPSTPRDDPPSASVPTATAPPRVTTGTPEPPDTITMPSSSMAPPVSEVTAEIDPSTGAPFVQPAPPGAADASPSPAPQRPQEDVKKLTKSDCLHRIQRLLREMVPGTTDADREARKALMRTGFGVESYPLIENMGVSILRKGLENLWALQDAKLAPTPAPSSAEDDDVPWPEAPASPLAPAASDVLPSAETPPSSGSADGAPVEPEPEEMPAMTREGYVQSGEVEVLRLWAGSKGQGDTVEDLLRGCVGYPREPLVTAPQYQRIKNAIIWSMRGDHATTDS